MCDLPLQFYEFSHIDHTQRCPKYSDVIRRAQSTPIQPNELDELYTDLESLLGAANVRTRRLESESKILSEWCDKKDRKPGAPEGLLEQYSNKKARAPFSEATKKHKGEDLTPKPGVKRVRNNRPTAAETNGDDLEMYVSKPRATYDAPNKFWSLVEPYCSDFTVDDLNMLEEMTQHECDDLYVTTTLGRHYTQRWRDEDMAEEQREGAKADRRRATGASQVSSFGGCNATNVEPDATMCKRTHDIALAVDDRCSFGSFTQRLVSAFVDENIVTPMEDAALGMSADQREASQPLMARSIHAGSTKSLEAAIKDELFNVGLIDAVSDDDSDAESEDEVLAELKRHQNELRAISAHNRSMADQLLNAARREMKKQELKQRVKAIDAEVMDAFRKITSAKQKKKLVTKKERDLAWKALRDREAILKLLDSPD